MGVSSLYCLSVTDSPGHSHPEMAGNPFCPWAWLSQAALRSAESFFSGTCRPFLSCAQACGLASIRELKIYLQIPLFASTSPLSLPLFFNAPFLFVAQGKRHSSLPAHQPVSLPHTPESSCPHWSLCPLCARQHKNNYLFSATSF